MSDLMDELKKEGLNIVEADLVKLVDVLFKVGSLKLVTSGKPHLIMFGSMLPAIKLPLLSYIDLLDGEDDQGY